jgi:WD40 repeat protein
LSWSPDSTKIVGRSKRDIVVLDIIEGGTESILDPSISGNNILSVTWTPDDQIFALISIGNHIYIWDTEDLKIMISNQFSRWGEVIAWSPKGNFVAIGSQPYLIQIWNARTGNPVRALEGKGAKLSVLSWSQDEKYLISINNSNVGFIWDVADDEVIQTLNDDIDYFTNVTWGSDGNTIISGHNNIKIWNFSTGKIVEEIERAAICPFWCPLSWSPDGSSLAFGSNGIVNVMDASRGEVTHSLEFSGRWVLEFTWSEVGDLLALGGQVGKIQMWEVFSGKTTSEFEFSGRLSHLAFSPEWDTVAFSEGPGKIMIINGTSGEFYKVLESPESSLFYNLRWSPDKKMLAACDTSGNIYIWNVANSQVIQTLETHSAIVEAIDWSPDGKFLASVNNGDTIQIWDVERGEVFQVLEEVSDFINIVAWSPDGTLIAFGNNDGTIQIWSVNSGKRLLELEGHKGNIYNLAWSPDGTLLATASRDGTFRIWGISIE